MAGALWLDGDWHAMVDLEQILTIYRRETGRGSTEAWVSRQNLQDVYQKLLVMDLEYALDKKVEQDLWNHAFKNQINTMQSQVKDKQNPKRQEIQASLNLFLETASGFYIQLLQELCSAFKLDLPFRRKASSIGILKEYGPVASKIRAPKKSSCLYICQHCLVHLGDIARYRQQIEQAQTHYRHAAQLVPANGQPYNQLAILEAAKANKLSTVFYYVHSIAVKHPFPVASTNLEKFFSKISRESLDLRGKLSMSEIVAAFLQMHALLHQSIDMSKAKLHSERLVASLPTHITSMSFSSYQLVQMVAINLFALQHARRKLDTGDAETGSDEKAAEETQKTEKLGKEEEMAYDMIFKLTVSLLDMLLQNTPKQENKAKEYHTLPALKVILDWLHTDRELISHAAFSSTVIWPTLSKLLNNLQFHTNQKDAPYELEKYQSVPLPEDCDLQCFTPLSKAHSDLDFRLMPTEGLFMELETRLRCHRLVAHGLWICDEFPSLNLLNAQKLKSGKLQFSAPAAQHIRVVHGSEDGKGAAERKSVRTNVAIQAIMQNKAKRSSSNTAPVLKAAAESGRTVTFQANAGPSRSDAGVMAHTATDPNAPNSPRPVEPDLVVGTPSKLASDLVEPPVQLAAAQEQLPPKAGRPSFGFQDYPGPSPSHSFQAPGTNAPRLGPSPSASHSSGLKPQQLPGPGLMSRIPRLPEQPQQAMENPTQPPLHPQERMFQDPAQNFGNSFGDFSTNFNRQHSPDVLQPHVPKPSFPRTPGNVPFQQPHFPVPTFSPGFSGNNSSMPAHSVAAQLFGQPDLRPATLKGQRFHLDEKQHADRRAAADVLLGQPFGSPRMPSNFSMVPEEVPKPDSPPTVSGLSSLFSGHGHSPSDLDNSSQSASTYSLFTESPWNTLQLNKADNKSLSSSPFGSSSSSLRTTPDLFTDTDRLGGPAPYHMGGSQLGYSMPPPSTVGVEQAGWNAETAPSAPVGNVQDLWSSGPSALERLLEQQKQQRQTDPH